MILYRICPIVLCVVYNKRRKNIMKIIKYIFTIFISFSISAALTSCDNGGTQNSSRSYSENQDCRSWYVTYDNRNREVYRRCAD